MVSESIQLRGVHVHNLKHLDVDIPHQQLVVICGVSGSGKTSLALDTLYAEGQRRYIESFSAYTRQFLERLEKPLAESIEGIPPAIAVTSKSASSSNRATVGTATEVIDFLRLLFARVGRVECPKCQELVQRDSPESATAKLERLPPDTRFMVTFPSHLSDAGESLEEQADSLREDGFIRWIVNDRIVSIDAGELFANGTRDFHVIVDRLTIGQSNAARVGESIETAMSAGGGRCHLFFPHSQSLAAALTETTIDSPISTACMTVHLDDQPWLKVGFNQELVCETCGWEFPRSEPRLFSFNSPLGACPECEGFGNIMKLDMDLVVPHPHKSISEGAIAPWSTPAYQHELEQLMAIAEQYGLPVHVPFRELSEEHLRIIREGIPEQSFRGLNGFFAWLERKKYAMHIRIFLSRWRSYDICPQCRGARLRPEALAVKIAKTNIAEVCQMQIRDVATWLAELTWDAHEGQIAGALVDQIDSRLKFLNLVGLGHLTLDRTLRTLSSGENQRVALTSALGSSLVNMLYVLDEPSVGLHPRDVQQLLLAVESLRDRGNTVVVVEHDESMILAADQVVELGPAAGDNGGQITFQGTPHRLCDPQHGGMTGDYLMGRRGQLVPESRRETEHGWIRLRGATGNNLQNISVEFPLGVLCVVSGVSGAGKSTLVEHTLFPAVSRRKRKEGPKPMPHDEVIGVGQIDDIVLIDQAPIGRSARSNPVTYIKAFDAIRAVFADTLAARTRNFKASHFSFNVEGGRCEACQGDGSMLINMQFLPDIEMPCSECRGRRYRREILGVTYRGKSIADVLEMTVQQATHFFRGQPKVQSKLQQLIDVGLEYLRLGQSANTLSAGEAQRLKLASYLSGKRRGRTLFVLDEPTTGLHFSDVIGLLDCFDALIDSGHSLIVIEHNLQVILSADYVIDLGPGAADRGGTVVALGTPEAISAVDSPTGLSLREKWGRERSSLLG